MGDTIFFAADDHTAGNELWESDGTGAGTSLVKDISPRSLDSNPRLLTRFGDRLLFAANQDTWGIWISDGTDEGTIRLSDVGHPDTNSNMVVIGNDAYFAATDSIHGLGLWKTDGTPQGTSLVKGISGGTSASSLRELTNVGGTLYYFVNDGSGSAELWRSDGTTPGTSLVKRFNSVGSGLRYPTAYNGILFFSADDGAHGAELWKSDGTAAGTALVDDIFPGVSGSAPAFLGVSGGKLFFTANDGSHGQELWTSDGLPGGTRLVKDINPGPGGFPIQFYTAFGGTTLISANDGSSGFELWRTDGTSAGTKMVADLAPGAADGAPVLGNGALAGQFIFSATHPDYGREIWRVTAASASAGGPYVVTSGSSVQLDATASTDPDPAETLTYSWDLDGDGVFGETGAAAARGDELGATPTFSAAGVGAWSYPVSVRVTNSTGLGSTASAVVNVTPAPGTALPVVTGFASRADTNGTEVELTFNEDVGQSLTPDDLRLVNQAKPAAPPLTASLVVYDPDTHAATFTFPAPGGGGPLPDADYSATLLAAGVYDDAAKNHLDGDADGTAGGDWTGTFSQLTGLIAEPGSAYTLTGPATAKVLTVTAGTVTLTRDLSAGYPGVSLDVSGDATVVFATDQNFANVSLSGNGTISVGQPPQSSGAGAVAGTPTPTPAPTPAPVPSSQSLVLTAQSAAFVRDGAYANTAYSTDPSLVVKKGPAGYTRETFLMFDLSRVGAIHSAKLRLFGRLNQAAPKGVAVRVYAAGGALPKGRLTWHNRPTTGGSASPSTTVAGTGGRWYEWDVGQLLRAARAAGARSVTLALKGAAATDAAALFDGGRTGANGPRLILA